METQTQQIDLRKVAHSKEFLSEQQIRELEENGYICVEYKDNVNGGKRARFVKVRNGEPKEHLCAICDIIDFLREQEYETAFNTKESPDIVFVFDNKKWGIQVETGAEFSNDSEGFKKKVNWMNKNYGNNWVFFVLDKEVEDEYKQFGKTLSPLNFKEGINNVLAQTN